jgi:recombination protein RecR
LPKEEVDNLISSISQLKNNIKTCEFCFKPFEPSAETPIGLVCEICRDVRRDRSLLCIVANETDLMAIEKTKKYNGLYFILGGTISAFKKTDIEKLRIKELEEKVKNNREIKEIILAINPTTEGETTALYLERILKPSEKKISRLGRGLPLGAELEYADEETLSSALEGRR